MDFRKKLKQRFRIAVSYIVLGLVLVTLDAVNHYENYFISSFGFALLLMGALRLIVHRKVTKDDASVRKQELSETDERTLMISEKAKSWVFSLSIVISGILVIGLNLLGYQEAALPFAWYVCGMIILYWICWIIIRKKY
jgi:uncharacterized membrane protein